MRRSARLHPTADLQFGVRPGSAASGRELEAGQREPQEVEQPDERGRGGAYHGRNERGSRVSGI